MFSGLFRGPVAESGMRHRHLIAPLIAAAAMLALMAGSAVAAEIEIPPRRASPDTSVQQGPANCSRWTDECVNCARGADGEPPVCSNIGFACQPKAVRCLSPNVPQSEPRKQ